VFDYEIHVPVVFDGRGLAQDFSSLDATRSDISAKQKKRHVAEIFIHRVGHGRAFEGTVNAIFNK
jgi:hypothetical protein